MKRTFLNKSAGACVALAALVIPSLAQAQAKIGSTPEEIIELAKQEPPVTFATTWEGEIIDYEINGFKEKYGLDMEFVFVTGVESRERILNEALAGVNEIDLVNVSSVLEDTYVEAGVSVPVDWKELFPEIQDHQIKPDNHFLATGWNQFVIAYNPTMVSDEEAPKDWQDCLDPKWKGKIAVYTRPLAYIQTYFNWGKEKAVEYHKALAAQDPVWTSSTNSTVALMAAGEYPVVCGIQYHAVKNVLREDPSAPVAFIVPKLFPVQPGEKVTVMAAADSPNAAVLLAGYLATEGAPGYDLYGRSDPMTKGTDAYEYSREAGATPYFAGWDKRGDIQAEAAATIVEAWGFPKGK